MNWRYFNALKIPSHCTFYAVDGGCCCNIAASQRYGICRWADFNGPEARWLSAVTPIDNKPMVTTPRRLSAPRPMPPTGRAGRTTGWSFAIASLIPIAWLLAFAWLVLQVRVVTGDWPAPYRPDPQSIGGLTAIILSGTLPLIYIMGLAAVAALLVMSAVPSFRSALRDARLRSWHVCVGLAGMALMAILLHGNPWQLRDWLAD